MTIESLFTLSNPNLRKEEGSVWEIWEDGEITLQKCGSLYGQRNLHCIVPPVVGLIPKIRLPEGEHKHSLMAVHRDDLVKARKLIVTLNGFDPDLDSYRYTIPGYSRENWESA